MQIQIQSPSQGTYRDKKVKSLNHILLDNAERYDKIKHAKIIQFQDALFDIVYVVEIMNVENGKINNQKATRGILFASIDKYAVHKNIHYVSNFS